ncbi:beta-lactamase family protein [Kineosporia sp. J2-2]|uniref:Beta-lactamase family protein n=1 Tax=Kineosporia corallincola TaxID=2835133 RepID=A0ABS5TG67_9ACTN|nr:serine hydrolase domain-containing protein [Kineosporia corallincola]MBT0769078.1 beta-lactamase family protein [Kineosporia corallincola]
MDNLTTQSAGEARPWRRRSLLGAFAAAPVATGGALSAGGAAASSRIPPATRPGGSYDRYVTKLASEGRFSGTVLLSHRGRTVLSRSFGMADRERGIRNGKNTVFTLSSAGKPFSPVAVLQLVQRGKLALGDPIGKHLTGFRQDVAENVTVHHLLSGSSWLATPDEDIQRVYRSREEVHEYCEWYARQAEPIGTPGLPDPRHAGAGTAVPALLVEAASGQSYWDYVQENIFDRAGMSVSAFYTRPQWLTDRRLAHPYMRLADGSEVDALHHLDQGSPDEWVQGRNPGRAFIDAPGDGGFASAPDLVRFARRLYDGTLLDRPWADVLTAARFPQGPSGFGSYGVPVHIVGGQWEFSRAGANPGVGASWSIYPDTGWVGVVLGNTDGLPLQEMSLRMTEAVTGVLPDASGG